MFDIRDLQVPVIVAPMAGGPSTPALAAGGTNSGGLGFLAAGYLTADALAQQIREARARTSGPLGVNLFVPQASVATAAEIEGYARDLAVEAQRYGVSLGDPKDSDDEYAAKLEVVLDLKPEVVSFTFGVGSADECRRLSEAGIATVGSVTTAHEAELAVASGVNVLAAQGPGAGGHRGTFDPSVLPATQPLPDLLAELRVRFDVPVIAAGGLSTAVDVASTIDAGAVAVQLGTAFLLADEAGSSPVHRAALQSPEFTETIVTKAFSGRYARGLRNRFIDEHEAQAPLGYTQVHYLTSPLRRGSVQAGDPHATNVWAGTGFRHIRTGSVAEIIASLV